MRIKASRRYGAAMAAPALADTSIGQTGGEQYCLSDLTVIQLGVGSGTSFTVPSGSWTLTSWSTQGGESPDAEAALVVVRPTGNPGEYTVVGVSQTETLTPGVLNTFPTSIRVEGGDLLGLAATGDAICANETGDDADTYTFVASGPPPSAGDTVSEEDGTDFDFITNISATLSPLGAQVDSMFVCYSKYEQDGGAVFTAAQASGLLAAGGWVPSAVSGNIAGGDNLGAYHLECNPPDGLTPTGQYVGGGGDVVDATVAANAQTGYYPIVG